MPPVNVFISYSRSDSQYIEPISKLLQIGDDRVVFFDMHSIRPGDLWRDRIEGAVKDATYVLVFWCRHSCRSVEVRREWELALETGKKLVPVLLDSTPMSRELAPFQGIDCVALATPTHSPSFPGLVLAGALALVPRIGPLMGLLIGALSMNARRAPEATNKAIADRVRQHLIALAEGDGHLPGGTFVGALTGPQQPGIQPLSDRGA